MQTWDACKNGDGAAFVRATDYVKARLAPAEISVPVLAGSVTVNRPWVGEGSQTPSRTSSVILRCSCGSGQCYKVMRVDSIRRALEREQSKDPLNCPAHQEGPLSTWHFLEALKVNNITGYLLWDWCCVPTNSKMHIDATLVQPKEEVVHMFEIDGSSHWQQGYEVRQQSDEEKDALLVELGLGVLRMHYKDTEQWPLYIHHFVKNSYRTVKYTASYSLCMDSSEHIIKL